MAPDPTADYLTAEQIAAELGVHPQTIQRAFRTGGLPGRKVGKSWRTTRAALDTWIAGGNTALEHRNFDLDLETK